MTRKRCVTRHTQRIPSSAAFSRARAAGLDIPRAITCRSEFRGKNNEKRCVGRLALLLAEREERGYDARRMVCGVRTPWGTGQGRDGARVSNVHPYVKTGHRRTRGTGHERVLYLLSPATHSVALPSNSSSYPPPTVFFFFSWVLKTGGTFCQKETEP